MAALRAIPNHLVFRPADAMETAECWEIALNSRTAPSTLALTRQNLPAVRKEYSEENLSARGAYELAQASDDAAVTIFATGSEVEIALAARDKLEAHGHPTRVVSVPCFELFEQQSREYQNAIIGSSKVNIAIEAGIRQGWDRFIGRDGIFIGMHGFGASGPYEKLYEHFGITADAAAAAAEKLLHPKK
jgi:transketolase